MTGNSPSAWPSLPAGSALADGTGQEAARQNVISWFRAAPWRHQPPREPGSSPEVPPDGSRRSASSRDRRTGRFTRRPEQPPAPDDDACSAWPPRPTRAGPAHGRPRPVARPEISLAKRCARPGRRPGSPRSAARARDHVHGPRSRRRLPLLSLPPIRASALASPGRRRDRSYWRISGAGIPEPVSRKRFGEGNIGSMFDIKPEIKHCTACGAELLLPAAQLYSHLWLVLPGLPSRHPGSGPGNCQSYRGIRHSGQPGDFPSRTRRQCQSRRNTRENRP